VRKSFDGNQLNGDRDMNCTISLASVAMASAVLSFGTAAAQTPNQVVGGSASAPTYTEDIAPLLYRSCASCHRAGETAPMSLMTYEEVRPWARAIRRAVVSRSMPPWPADRKHGRFKNDPSLSDAEIQTVARWVDAGAPQGDPAAMPLRPHFAQGWRGGQPDLVVQMPVDYPVPADGQLDVLHFWVPVPFNEDRYLQALELRPGNPAVVHHSRVDVVDLPPGLKVVDGRLVKLDGSPDDGLGPDGRPRTVFDGQDNNYHLISFVPGRGFERHPAGSAKRLEGGKRKYVRFELHYNPNGTATTDRSMLGLWFAKEPVTSEVYTRSVGQPLSRSAADGGVLIAEGKELKTEEGPDGRRRRARLPNIPPFAENWRVTGITTITEPITLLAVSPHMHLRGKDMKVLVTWPDGREETVLSVPNYDYNWQFNFELETQLFLPAGSKLISIGHYDNSVKNRYNPAPQKEVYWSDQSWDEMFIPYIEFTTGNRVGQSSEERKR
jgi:hypothetical protein